MLPCAAWATEEASEGVAGVVAGRDRVGVAGVVGIGHWNRVCIRLGFLRSDLAGLTRGLPECMGALGETAGVLDSLQIVERQRRINFLRASPRHLPGAGT